MTLHTTTSAHAAALSELLDDDDRRVVVSEAASRGGLDGTLQGLAERFGPRRLLDVPVVDRAAVAMAVGLALGGRRPIVELSSTGRLLAALEPLAEAASIHLDREFALPLVVRVLAGGQAGPRVDRDLAHALSTVPGLRVVAPSDAMMAVGLLRAAARAEGPVVVLEPRALATERTEVLDLEVPIGSARAVRSGDHLTLASWGTGVSAAQQAADTLADEGIEATVLDLVSLNPIDVGTLGRWTTATGRLVVVDAPEGGLSVRVLEAALGPSFLYFEAPPGAVAADPTAIAAAARAAVHY